MDTAIENVIDPDLQVNAVYGYQRGNWIVAHRTADGEWMGYLTEIGSGWGYWVHTPVAETIEVALTTMAAGSFRRCTSGWNLEGVVDAELRPAGTKIDASDNFEERFFEERFSDDWRVAHGFDAAANRWDEPIKPGSGATLETGAGYWVWVSRPCGGLVP